MNVAELKERMGYIPTEIFKWPFRTRLSMISLAILATAGTVTAIYYLENHYGPQSVQPAMPASKESNDQGYLKVFLPPVQESANSDITSELSLEELNKIPLDKFLKNLQVGANGANIRKRSLSLFDSDIIGKLEPGALIPEALIWIGNDPMKPYEQSSSSRWYFVPARDEAGQITGGFFIWSGNIDPKTLPTPSPR